MPENKLHRVCPPHGPCPLCHHEEGAEEERAAVVAWLRVKRDDADSMTTSDVVHGNTIDALAMFLARSILRDAADAIERGEHVGRND